MIQVWHNTISPGKEHLPSWQMWANAKIDIPRSQWLKLSQMRPFEAVTKKKQRSKEFRNDTKIWLPSATFLPRHRPIWEIEQLKTLSKMKNETTQTVKYKRNINSFICQRFIYFSAKKDDSDWKWKSSGFRVLRKLHSECYNNLAKLFPVNWSGPGRSSYRGGEVKRKMG